MSTNANFKQLGGPDGVALRAGISEVHCVCPIENVLASQK